MAIAKPSLRALALFRAAAALSMAVAGPGCDGFGSEIDPLRPDAAPAPADTAAAPPVLPGTGGMPPVPGTGGAGGMASDTAAPVPETGPPPAGEACPASTAFAILLTIDVTWPGNAATTSGTGVVRIWNKVDITATGNNITGSVTPCGTELPETVLSGLGRAAAGGSKILIEVPTSVWDQPSMPKFPLTGSRAHANLGAALELQLAAPLGFMPKELRAPWPESYTALKDQLVDPDGDGLPGYWARPRPDGGYVQPPTSLGLGGLAPAAEKLALISRNVLTLSGMRTACDAFDGSATVHHFDSHVVGCAIRGGAACNASQIDFVDQNRMKYMPRGARFSAKQVAATASCTEIRSAFPR